MQVWCEVVPFFRNTENKFGSPLSPALENLLRGIQVHYKYTEREREVHTATERQTDTDTRTHAHSCTSGDFVEGVRDGARTSRHHISNTTQISPSKEIFQFLPLLSRRSVPYFFNRINKWEANGPGC
jgi:hypothetical protein